MRSARKASIVIAFLATPLAALAQGNTGPAGNPQHDARSGHHPPEMIVPQPNRPSAPTGTGTPVSPGEAQEHLQHLERNAQVGGPEVRVGELDLYSPGGEKLGEVEDVMLDGEGRLAGYIIETRGVLGIGERELFVPSEAARLERDTEGRARLVTSQQLTTFQAASRARQR